MIHHCFYLQLSSYDLECASLLPAEFSLPFSSENWESKITSILKQEFGILAVEGICSKSHFQWHVQKNQHHAAKMQNIENNYLPTQSIIVVLDLLITANVTFVNNKRFVVSVVWNAMKLTKSKLHMIVNHHFHLIICTILIWITIQHLSVYMTMTIWIVDARQTRLWKKYHWLWYTSDVVNVTYHWCQSVYLNLHLQISCNKGHCHIDSTILLGLKK